MTTLYSTRGTANYIVSEANNLRSREAGTVAAGATGLIAGTILGKLTAGGNLVALDTSKTDGSQTVAGILYEAAKGTVKRTYTARDSEVNGAHLIYPTGANDAAKATINAALVALGIIVR